MIRATANSTQSLVLIVDDTPTNLEVISVALSDAGYDVAIATSGERALVQVERRLPDLILLDVMMPGIDGFETCNRLKSNPQTADIPVIFMTALADVEHKVKGLELGAVDYITKPFQEQEVLARVRTHLRLRQTEERLESILNSLEEVVWSITLEPLQCLYLNPAVERIFGQSPEEFYRRPQLWFDLIHPEDQERVRDSLSSPDPLQDSELEYRILTAEGMVRWVRIRAQAAPHGDAARLDGILHDISDRKQVETKLLHSAQHDALTGLRNRSCFIEKVTALMERSPQDSDQQYAVLFIDLDRFKSINDSLGHHNGDLLLTEVARILCEALRPTDTIARLGGDEFTVLLEKIHHPGDAIRVTERILSKLAVPICLEEHTIVTSASIGIAVSSAIYQSADELIRDADIAMYQAKRQGKASYQLFKPEMHAEVMHQLELEQDLRLAIERQEFELYYQPILDLDTETLTGFEALVRWHHPERGIVSPAAFIPLAEESGLIEPLGEQILRQACLQMHRWQTEYDNASDITMSVNLSSRQLQSTHFLNMLDAVLAETEVAGAYLALEITESLLLENDQALLKTLHALQERQIQLSLDDFGTGYSSLSYLHRFPIDVLKIDRSFINGMEADSQSYEIVKTITTLAQVLQMTVVAEGVETEQQMSALKALRCNRVQGYFFSKPLPAEHATAWLLRSGKEPAQLLSHH
ncbi:MAG: EAL domain-containing protein [Cyanobacteria bacterium P01_A01_bin.17]